MKLSDDNRVINGNRRAITLAGRIPTKVSTINGPIYAGDLLTSSPIKGVAMKATKAGPIIGKALQNYTNSDPNTVEKIIVLLNISWYDPDVYLTSTGDLQIVRTDGNGEDVYDGNLSSHPKLISGSSFDEMLKQVQHDAFVLKNSTGELIERIGAFAQILAAKIKTGLLETEEAVVNNVLAAKNIVAENIQSLTLNVERLTVSQKIISPIVETTNLVTTGEASLNTISTNEIKPQNGDLVINLNNNEKTTDTTVNVGAIHESPLPNSSGDKGPLARLIIKGLEGKTAVVIDASGNASFSGSLSTLGDISALGNLKVNKDATISGNLATNTLNATEASISGKIIAKEVEAENINEIQRLLAEIKNAPLPDPNYYQNIDSNVRVGSSDPNTGTNTVPLQMYGSGLATLQDLTVTGQSNLYNVSVSGSLLVGQTLIENNSITTLASEMRLSALDKITLFDGAVTIAKDGTITTKGTLIAQGGIKTSTIAPLEKEVSVLGDLTVLGDLKLKKATDSAVIAAPENFAKNGIFAPAIEASSSAAGVGIIPASSSEVVIYSSFAKPNSLIYLTPKTSPPISLSVFEKKDGFFRVIRNQLLDQEITFDWLIIN
jgi:hypothetical protein